MEGGVKKNMRKGRGLASASAETRSRVASAGGRASHGGGRPKTKKLLEVNFSKGKQH